MMTLFRNRQGGFTLLEVIVALVLTAIVGSMIYQYFGTAQTQSSVPIFRLKQAADLQQVMENIIGDYDSGSWQANTAYAVDNLVGPTSKNGYFYKCTSAGMSDSTANEPAWPTTVGQTVTDNTVEWTTVTVLAGLKEKIGAEGSSQNNAYGQYSVVDNDYMIFSASGGNYVEASAGTNEQTLKVTIKDDDLEESLTVLLTSE